MISLSDSLSIIAWSIPVFGIAQAALVVDNLNSFQRDRFSTPRVGIEDLVSILIPARNEEENIEACLSSLEEQSYENFEVIVLDDCSDDKTYDLAAKYRDKDSRFRVIRGESTPDRWTGKNYACHQLSEAARGEWFLFLDADTRLTREALGTALAIAHKDNAALLSLWPHQKMESPEEKLIIPLLSFILLGYLPLRFAEASDIPIFTAANGQFMLFKKDSYKKFGGHATIKDEIMDDVRSAQRVKEAGGKVLIRDASKLIHCRMYKDFNSIWNGFKKNIYPAFNNRPIIFSFSIGALALGHALPLILAVLAVISGSTALAIPLTIQFFIGLIIRLILAIRLEQPYPSIFMHPVAVSITVLIAINSFLAYNSSGVSWKGRIYKRG